MNPPGSILRPYSNCRLREIATIVLSAETRDRARRSALLTTSACEPATNLAD